MTVANKSGLWAALFGATVVGGVVKQNIVLESEIKNEPTSGEILPRFQALYSQKLAPGISFYAIADALDECGVGGLNLASTAFHLHGQAWADGGGRQGATSHRKFSFAKGIMAPSRLQVSHGGDAVIDYQLVVTSADGSAAPMTFTDSLSLPAGIGDAERFTLGPVTIGGKSFTQNLSFAIDFGIDVVSEGADSDIWETFAAIREQQTVLNFQVSNPQILAAATVPLVGLAGSHANSTIYLRKRADGGTFVSDVTVEHVKFTAAGLCVLESIASIEGNDGQKPTLRMPLKYDGTNLPLVIDTTSAIP